MRWRLALVALSLAAGCGPKAKIAECRALVAAVNAGLERVTDTVSDAPAAERSPADLRDLAKAMEATSKDVAALDLSISELQQLAARYQEMTDAIASTARSLADAVDAVDIAKRDELQAEMEEAVKRESPLVEALNGFCQSP